MRTFPGRPRIYLLASAGLGGRIVTVVSDYKLGVPAAAL